MITETLLYFAILVLIITNIYLFSINYLQKEIYKAEKEILEVQIEQLKYHNKFLQDYFWKHKDKKTS